MSYLRYVARRALLAVASVYGAVTATFLLGNLTIRKTIGDQLARARYGGASPEEIRELRRELMGYYGLDQPVHERLLGYLADVTMLDLGRSLESGRPLVDVLGKIVPNTLEYVVPGVLIAVVFGVAFGLFAALSKNGVFDWSVRLSSYFFLGIPVFMLLVYMQYVSGWYAGVGPLVVQLPAPNDKTLAAVAVALGLLAGQLRFSRAAALEQSGQAFVKMLRAKGAGRLRLARHVLRNAAIPIVSLSITELLAVLVLNIYVIEEVLGIRGLAGASLQAARSSNIPLLVWSTMVVVILGITLNFLQDVLYGYLDPRIRAE